MPKVVKDEQIFRAVIQVVSERGYASATTKQMAELAEVSEMTLFRKYESKAELVRQAISFIVKQTIFASAPQYTGNVHADLFKVVQTYHEAAVKHGLCFFALFSEFERHPELTNSLDEPLNMYRAIGGLIERYQSEGILKQENPLHAVATLLGPLMYIATIRRVKLGIQVPPLDLSAHVIRFLEGHRTSRSSN